MMLITNLHYYPDASSDASVAFGTLTCFFHEEKKSRMSWFEPTAGAIVATQSVTDEAWMRRILQNFSAFIDGIIDELPESLDGESFARDLLNSLPVNFRHGKISGYPDADFVLRLAQSLNIPIHTQASTQAIAALV